MQVNKIAPLVSAPDPLDLDGASYLNLLSGPIDDLASPQGEVFPAYLLHKGVKFLPRIYGLVLVDTPILRERGEVVVVQDPWDDALGDDSVASVVN